MTKGSWGASKRSLAQVDHISHDWLTPCEYIPYIDALLKTIDLDPCSTYDANCQFLRAEKIYTYEQDGLNIDEPWVGKTYLFPPTYGRCSFAKKRGTWRWSLSAGKGAKAPSVIWFKRLLREWKLRNIPEALFFTTYPEMIRVCPEMWDYPVCVPYERANLIHGKKFECLDSPINWGYFIYLPALNYGFDQVDRFKYIFSNIGKIVC